MRAQQPYEPRIKQLKPQRRSASSTPGHSPRTKSATLGLNPFFFILCTTSFALA